MKRAALPLLFSVMSLYADDKWAYDITLNTRAAINALRVGASEADVLALLRPVSLDSGRVTWGGTGSGVLYFQVSATQQISVEIDGTKGFVVSRIGKLEPLGVWTRDRFGGLSVQPRKPNSK